jgi:hypothetical protein
MKGISMKFYSQLLASIDDAQIAIESPVVLLSNRNRQTLGAALWALRKLTECQLDPVEVENEAWAKYVQDSIAGTGKA